MKTAIFRDRWNAKTAAIAIALITVLAAMGTVRVGIPGALSYAEEVQAWRILEQFVEVHDPIWETGEFPALGSKLRGVADDSQNFRTQLDAEMTEIKNQRAAVLTDGFRIESHDTYLHDAKLSRAANGGFQIEATVAWDATYVNYLTSKEEYESGDIEYLIILPSEATGSRAKRSSNDSEDWHVQIQRVSNS